MSTRKTRCDEASENPEAEPSAAPLAAEQEEADPMAEAPETTMEEEPEAEAPTLDDAFFTLCAAMSQALVDDMPAWGHCQEIQVWMTNAGGDAAGRAQAAKAWAHAVHLLEQVLGTSLVQR